MQESKLLVVVKTQLHNFYRKKNVFEKEKEHKCLFRSLYSSLLLQTMMQVPFTFAT